MKDFAFYPPGGVAIQMWKDGSLHFRIGQQQIAPLQFALKELERQLSAYAVELIEKEKAAEIAKTVLPPTRIEVLEQELAKLKAADAAKALPKTIVSEGFEPNDGSLPVPGSI
jgi:hypothetical protein